jgi:hypothetical protein
MAAGVVAEGLVNRFGSFTAVDGVDLVVPEATPVGLPGREPRLIRAVIGRTGQCDRPG